MTSSLARTPWLHPVAAATPAWHLMTAVWDEASDSWQDMRAATLIHRLTRDDTTWLVVRGLEQDPELLESLVCAETPEALHKDVLGVWTLTGDPARWTAQLAASPWAAELGLTGIQPMSARA